jgi:hypothetical protein
MPEIFVAQRSYFFAPIFLRHKKTPLLTLSLLFGSLELEHWEMRAWLGLSLGGWLNLKFE